MPAKIITLNKLVEKTWLNPIAANNAWLETWNESSGHKPFDGKILPGEKFWQEICKKFGFRSELSDAIKNAYLSLGKNIYLRRLFQHCHFLMFEKKTQRDNVYKWPVLEENGLFYALVYLAGTPWVISENRKRSIKDEITISTLKDIELWILHDKNTGNWQFKNLGWLWFHFHNKLFALGRLQFCLDTFNFDYVGLINNNGAFCLIAPGKQIVRRDGQFNGTSGIDDPESFQTIFQETDNKITGHEITINGKITKETQIFAIDKNNWQVVLRRNDKAISVHIPATGPLCENEVKQSFSLSIPFFQKHFPDFKFNIFFSVTWLFDNNLPLILPPSSNIVKFQKIFHLFPVPGATDNQIWERVFGEKPNNMEEVTPKTSLQKAMIEHVKNGKHFHIQGGILLKDFFIREQKNG